MSDANSRRSLDRRAFVRQLGVACASALSGVALSARRARPQAAQQVATPPGQGVDSSNLFAMDQTASRPITLPPKPGARASMTAAERDELEHQIRCQCGCTLDVYTCRTTDFSCLVSPAMHRDILALVRGGYTGSEILDAFVKVYGERVLMAPSKEGFNLLGWMAPFVALGGGAVAVTVLVRNWRRATSARSIPVITPPRPTPIGVTEDELARLEAAVRNDE